MGISTINTGAETQNITVIRIAGTDMVVFIAVGACVVFSARQRATYESKRSKARENILPDKQRTVAAESFYLRVTSVTSVEKLAAKVIKTDRLTNRPFLRVILFPTLSTWKDYLIFWCK